MKAVAVFPGKQEVKVIDHPEPQITSADNVKIRVLDIGICGTDKEICLFEYGTPPRGSDYLIIGHEALGEVGELGTNGIYALTGVPGLQSLIEVDAASLFRTMVLKNQVVLGSLNAGGEAFTAAIEDLAIFASRWPDVLRDLIAGRYPIEEAPDLIMHRAGGIKSVISFDKAAFVSS